MFILLCAVGAISAKPNIAMAAAKGLDSELDNPVKGKMSQDDFATTKEWEEYLMEHPEEAVSVMGLWYPDTHMHVDVTKEYTIVGLKNSRVMQAFHFDKNKEYLYVSQRENEISGDGVTESMRISRCKIDEESKTAIYEDHMILVNFGHGQTLEGYDYNGKTYFWTTMKANTAYDYAWGLQVGRVEYQAGKTIDGYECAVRFSDLAYANKSMEEFGAIKRVDAALSTDGTKIVLWSQKVDNAIQYSVYRTDVLNAYLDVVDLLDAKYVSFKDNYILQAACLSSFSQDAIDAVLPNGSQQGVELSDDGKIYIAGGNVGEAPEIAVLDTKSGAYDYSNLMTLQHEDFVQYRDYVEMEYLKLTHTGIYVGAVIHENDAMSDKGYYIYFLPYEKIGQAAVHTETELRNAKTATCTEEGYSGDTHCKGCGELLREGKVIPALGHAWDVGVVMTPAQAAVEGRMRYTCTRGCRAFEDRVIPATGIAPAKGTNIVAGNLRYKITKSGLTGGRVQCLGVVTPAKTVTIPKTIVDQGVTYSVTTIAEGAFRNDNKMTKVTIGSNVTTIYKQAFYKAKKLTTVSGASGLTTIGKQTFSQCPKLTTVTFGSKLNKIYTKAFYKSSKLSKITIKSTKLTSKKVSSSAFSGIKSGAKVNVPNKKISSYRTIFRKRGLNSKAKVY